MIHRGTTEGHTEISRVAIEAIHFGPSIYDRNVILIRSCGGGTTRVSKPMTTRVSASASDSRVVDGSGI